MKTWLVSQDDRDVSQFIQEEGGFVAATVQGKRVELSCGYAGAHARRQGDYLKAKPLNESTMANRADLDAPSSDPTIADVRRKLAKLKWG